MSKLNIDLCFSESPYRDLISDAILKLQEEQVITLLYNKWWREGYGAVKCENEDANKDASELGVSTVGGVFVVLGGGLATGLIAAMMEFVWKAKKNAEEDKVSIFVFLYRQFSSRFCFFSFLLSYFSTLSTFLSLLLLSCLSIKPSLI